MINAFALIERGQDLAFFATHHLASSESEALACELVPKVARGTLSYVSLDRTDLDSLILFVKLVALLESNIDVVVCGP